MAQFFSRSANNIARISMVMVVVLAGVAFYPPTQFLAMDEQMLPGLERRVHRPRHLQLPGPILAGQVGDRGAEHLVDRGASRHPARVSVRADTAAQLYTGAGGWVRAAPAPGS